MDCEQSGGYGAVVFCPVSHSGVIKNYWPRALKKEKYHNLPVVEKGVLLMDFPESYMAEYLVLILLFELTTNSL